MTSRHSSQGFVHCTSEDTVESSATSTGSIMTTPFRRSAGYYLHFLLHASARLMSISISRMSGEPSTSEKGEIVNID